MPTLQDQLSALSACIQEKPPYYSGTLNPPSRDFTLFYRKKTDALSRRIDFSRTSEEEIQHLAQACDVATFGVNNQDVHDESYRKAGKLDTENFSPKFDPTSSGLIDVIAMELMEKDRDSEPIRAELYKLNVYGPGSFFKAHQDTPRGADMFASLVVVYPSAHEGGALILRHAGKEWTFDSSKIFAEQKELCLAYIVFFSDVEHEVLEVKSGYRVTITYNLYFAPPQPSSLLVRPFTFGPDLKAALQRLLEDPTFLPNGGHLGFGLSHRYPVELDGYIPKEEGRQMLHDLQMRLKGGDAIILQVCTDLGLKTSLNFLVEDTDMSVKKGGNRLSYVAYVMLDRLVGMDDDTVTGSMRYHLQDEDGKLVTPIPPAYRTESMSKPDILVRWVVPPRRDAQLKSRFIVYGNEPSVGYEYSHLCMVVDVGKFGKRGLGEVDETYDDEEFREAYGSGSDDDY